MDVVLAHAADLSKPSGGTDRVVAFACGLGERGHDVTLVVPTPTGDLPERLSGVRVRTVDVRTGGVWTQPGRAYRLTRTAAHVAARRNAHLQYEHATLGGFAAALGRGGDVLDIHDLSFASPLYTDRPAGPLLGRVVGRFEARGVRAADNVVVVSESMRAAICNRWDVSRESVTVIPNGYFSDDVADVTPDEPDGVRVAFVGTLHPMLDVDAVVNCARLDAVDELVVIGDGHARPDLLAAKDRHGLDALKLPGMLPRERTWSILAGADVAINPQRPSTSQRVSSPVKLYYYRALGLPMVVSAGPDVAEKFATEGVAKAVEPGADFAAHLEDVLTNRRTLERMQSAGDLQTSCDWDTRAAALSSRYESVFSG